MASSDKQRSINTRWRNIVPTGAPHGTPYSFWAREAQYEKLAIVFAGGGACWTGENADLDTGESRYNPHAGLETDPSSVGGIFDFDNPENPLASHTMIFLPTTNGDVFLGDCVREYDVPGNGDRSARKIEILHKGYQNAMMALDLVFRTFAQPKSVVIMGWSAGAIASPLYTHIVARQYPTAQVTHFADGAGAYNVGEKLSPLLQAWGTVDVLKHVPGFEDLEISTFSLEDLYVRAAKLNPTMTSHQYNERHDTMQSRECPSD